MRALERRSFWVAAICGILLNSACADQGPYGPAGEAAVQLPEFVDAYSGERWSGEVRIADIKINGNSVPDLSALASGGFNVAVEGDQLICTMPCGFGSKPGDYLFTVSTFGYRSAQMDVNVTAGRDRSSPVPMEVRPELDPWETPLEIIEVIPLDSVS